MMQTAHCPAHRTLEPIAAAEWVRWANPRQTGCIVTATLECGAHNNIVMTPANLVAAKRGLRTKHMIANFTEG